MQAMHRAVCSSSAAASYQLVGKSPVRLLGHFSDCHKVPSSLSPVCQCLTDVDRELGWGDGAASLVFSQTAPWVCICSRQFVGCWLFLSNWQCCSNASPPSKPVAPKETWTAIFLLPPFSLLLMPGWGPCRAAQQMAFFQGSITVYPAQPEGSQAVTETPFGYSRRKSLDSLLCASYPMAKRRFTQWIDIFQWAVTLCPSALGLCPMYFTLMWWWEVSCHLRRDLWGWLNCMCSSHKGPWSSQQRLLEAISLITQQIWEIRNAVTATPIADRVPRQLTTALQFMFMSLIPNVLFVRKAAQQCLRIRLLQVAKMLQSRVVSCKAEILTPSWETGEDGEVTEDIV